MHRKKIILGKHPGQCCSAIQAMGGARSWREYYFCPSVSLHLRMHRNPAAWRGCGPPQAWHQPGGLTRRFLLAS